MKTKGAELWPLFFKCTNIMIVGGLVYEITPNRSQSVCVRLPWEWTTNHHAKMKRIYILMFQTVFGNVWTIFGGETLKQNILFMATKTANLYVLLYLFLQYNRLWGSSYLQPFLQTQCCVLKKQLGMCYAEKRFNGLIQNNHSIVNSAYTYSAAWFWK